MTHICVSKLSITGSDNGLSLGRHQSIIWTNAGIFLIRSLGTNFNVIFIKVIYFHSKINSKISQCLQLPSLETFIHFAPARFKCMQFVYRFVPRVSPSILECTARCAVMKVSKAWDWVIRWSRLKVDRRSPEGCQFSQPNLPFGDIEVPQSTHVITFTGCLYTPKKTGRFHVTHILNN